MFSDGNALYDVAARTPIEPARDTNGIPLQPALTSGRQRQLIIKRVMDVILSAIALILLAPLMLLVAAAVFINDPGPVLFRQNREGINGRTFVTLKFRTMHTHRSDPAGTSQTVANDERVTSLGRILRKASIDELPQLFNVLMGDMSMVGPRPHVAGMLAGGRLYSDLVPYYSLRLLVQPGITGLAQVNGLRGPSHEASLAIARIDHDIVYVQRLSLLLDLRILVLTVWRELTIGTGT